MKEIALILTCRNEFHNINRLLDEILGQEVVPNEVIIVDAGSTDGTIECIRSYQEKYDFIKLIIKKDINRGAGRNLAISKATKGLIAVTDAGCFLKKSWLKYLVRPIIEENYDVSVGNYLPYYENDFEYFEGLQLVSNNIDTVRISSRSLAFKKEVWISTGGYNELVDVGEDTLFHIKFIQNKFRVYFSNNATVFWVMPSNTKNLFKKLFFYGRGYWQTIKIKEFRRFLYLIVGTYLWIVSLIISLYFINIVLAAVLTIFPVIILLYVGIKSSFETKKLKAIFYAPYIFIMNNLAFLLGFTFGKFIKREWS